MKVYNKLVRDRIPDIIAATGKTCSTRIVFDAQAIIGLLEEKFLEEWQEYRETRSPEELADLLEVLFALGNRLGVPESELLDLRRQKAQERGAFDRGIFLESVSED